MPLTIEILRNHPVASADIKPLRTAAWTAVGDRDWEPILRRSLGWVCAFDGDALVGFVNVAREGAVHAFLLDTTVRHSTQRRGVCAALVQEATCMARDRAAEWLHGDFDDALGPFYAACGYAPTSAGLIDLAGPTRSPGSP